MISQRPDHYPLASLLEEKGEEIFAQADSVVIQLDLHKDIVKKVFDLAEKYETNISIMTGFLDGINDSLVNPNPIEEMTEETEVNLGFDKEKLYYNMVEARADWLYELPQWDTLLTEERRKELYLEQKKSGTVVKDKKIGRNDPCPCGSGKKYKKCCGQ